MKRKMQEQINKTRKTLEHFQSFQGREMYLFSSCAVSIKSDPSCISLSVLTFILYSMTQVWILWFTFHYYLVTTLRTILAHGPGSQHWKLKFDSLGTVYFIHLTELVFHYYFIVYWRGTQAFVLILAARMHHQSYQTRNFFKHLFQLL